MLRVCLVVLALSLLPAWASAQDAAPPTDGSDGSDRTAPATAASAPEPARKPSYWTGPHVELSYRLRSLKDSQGGGRASTAAFSGFVPTRKVRLGAGVEAGARAYEYGDNEGLLSSHLFVGYQHLGDLGRGRYVPYVVALGELGVMFGKRFHTPETRLLRGAGVELGCDVNLVRTLYVGIGLGFMLYTMDDLAYDSFGMRLSIGL